MRRHSCGASLGSFSLISHSMFGRRRKNKILKKGIFGIFVQVRPLIDLTCAKHIAIQVNLLHSNIPSHVMRDVGLPAQLPLYFLESSYFKYRPLFFYKVDELIRSCATRKQRREEQWWLTGERVLLYSPTNPCSKLRTPVTIQLNGAQWNFFRFQKMYILFLPSFFAFCSINQGRSRRSLRITLT